jgi:hypothetical protein
MKQGFQMTRVNKLEQVRFAMLAYRAIDRLDHGVRRAFADRTMRTRSHRQG